VLLRFPISAQGPAAMFAPWAQRQGSILQNSISAEIDWLIFVLSFWQYSTQKTTFIYFYVYYVYIEKNLRFYGIKRPKISV
jgi:hypothetical protein